MNISSTTPSNMCIPNDCILSFFQELERNEVPMHSILMLYKGQLIAESYYKPCQKDQLHRMFSISKSFTALAIGFLIEEGKLKLSDHIVDYFPDMLPEIVHPYLQALTIEHMLMMRTCYNYTTYKVDRSKNWVASYFNSTPTHMPGMLFHYDTSSAHTLCALVERLSNMPMLDYLKEKLSALELSRESYMLTDPQGVSLGGTGLVCTSRDLAKVALFIAHKGELEGKQLLPASYMELITSDLTATGTNATVLGEASGYGMQFWRLGTDAYMCYGMGGQFMIFYPALDFICITTADTQGYRGMNQIIFNALNEEVIPYINGSKVAPSLLSDSEYENYLNSRVIAPLPIRAARVRDYSKCQKAIADKQFQIKENPFGYEMLLIHFDLGQSGYLEFSRKGVKTVIPFGLGHLELGMLADYDFRIASSGAWIGDSAFYIYVHILDCHLGNIRFEFSFKENEMVLSMRKVLEDLANEYQGLLLGAAL